MVTYEDALDHLGYDIENVDDVVARKVQRTLKSAEKILHGAVGEDLETYLPDDPRADELTLAYLDNLWDERGVVSAKVSNATRRLVADMEQQLRLELRRAKEATDV